MSPKIVEFQQLISLEYSELKIKYHLTLQNGIAFIFYE